MGVGVDCADWVYVGPENGLQIAVELPATDEDIEGWIEDKLGWADEVAKGWMVSKAIAKIGTGLGKSGWAGSWPS